jgi:hypothetical protein
VGTLSAENGITGLLDTAIIRASKTDLVERNGQVFGAFWMSGRTGTMQGLLRPDSIDPVVIATAESKLKRATRALQADGILRWTPPNDSSPRQLRFRREVGPAINGRRPKAWQLTLSGPDPYTLGSTEQHVQILAGAAAGEVGMTDPLHDPMSSALNTTGQQSVFNAGDAPTWPRFTITGPITNPTILNNSTGEQIVLSYTLNAGEWLDVFPERGVILAQSTADRYSALNFTASTWFQLGSGTTDLRLLASSFSAPASLDAWWRPAFE